MQSQAIARQGSALQGACCALELEEPRGLSKARPARGKQPPESISEAAAVALGK